MGYTHYWRQQRHFTKKEWGEIRASAKAICAESKIPLEVNDDAYRLSINGLAEDAYEDFTLSCEGLPFDFCKTAREPYDVVVCAILAAVHTRVPGVLSIKSDGEPEEWEPGVQLASKALGISIANPILGK